MTVHPLIVRWWRHAAVVLLVLVAAAIIRYWMYLQHLKAPLNLPAPYVLTVANGSNFTRIMRQLRQDGVIDDNDLLYYVHFHELANHIRAGEYELVAGMTPLSFLQTLLDGKVIEYQVRIGEGWTLRDAIKALQAHQAVKATLDADDPAAVQAAFATERYPEGLVFPETYNFERGTTDLDILQRARGLMDKLLETAWKERDSGLPYQSPYQALIMASIIEKESGQAAEQPMISGVFVRRLQMGMKLQTDPAVIYGIGPAFDGNITRKNLETDTPYNTYTRDGLPPTPIALPSRNAIFASVHPAPGNALYFVAKGDGTHYFSATLAEHNAAVKRYQLDRKP
ncbi:MAG TPA: endolytic transglycosylase MltG [Candidatus Acidoferrum sp.]|nr:endolytic transglycosylase MltG [Candidatus Acidoferrum sp.]